jgi:hypothetical protein
VQSDGSARKEAIHGRPAPSGPSLDGGGRAHLPSEYNGSGSFTLTLSGGGHSFSTTRTLANPALSSAEWIAEAPSMCAGSCRVLPLTNFGTVHFSGSSANGNAINDSAWSFDPLTMVTNGLVVKAAPSSLDSTGSAFDVTWSHS